MSQSKDKGRLNRYRKQTYFYVANKRLTLDLKTFYRLTVRGWKKLYHINRNEKKAWVHNIYIRQNQI